VLINHHHQQLEKEASGASETHTKREKRSERSERNTHEREKRSEAKTHTKREERSERSERNTHEKRERSEAKRLRCLRGSGHAQRARCVNTALLINCSTIAQQIYNKFTTIAHIYDAIPAISGASPSVHMRL